MRRCCNWRGCKRWARLSLAFLLARIELFDAPSRIPLSKRFGVRQGSKLKMRCVEDFSRFGINSRAPVCERPKPHTVDIIAAWAYSCNASTRGAQWKIRTSDLSGAYRQCAVHPDSSDFRYIIVAVPGENKCPLAVRNLYIHSFLRVAHSLWAIAVSEFLVSWANYFDDYVTFFDAQERVSVDSCVIGLC